MGCKANGCGIFGYIVTCMTAALYGVSIGTTYWRTPGATSLTATVTLQNLDQTYGLFENCVTTSGNRVCTMIRWEPDIAGSTLTATRSLVLVGGLFIVIGIIVGLAAMCGSGNIKGQGACNILGGLIIMIGCAVYIGMSVLVTKEVSNPPTPTDFGYSHYMCWVSGVLFIFAGICCLNGKRKDSGNEVHPATMQAQMVWATNAQPRVATISPHGQHQLALIKA